MESYQETCDSYRYITLTLILALIGQHQAAVFILHLHLSEVSCKSPQTEVFLEQRVTVERNFCYYSKGLGKWHQKMNYISSQIHAWVEVKGLSYENTEEETAYFMAAQTQTTYPPITMMWSSTPKCFTASWRQDTAPSRSWEKKNKTWIWNFKKKCNNVFRHERRQP